MTLFANSSSVIAGCFAARVLANAYLRQNLLTLASGCSD
jgi:hypothetical protein